MTLKTNSVNDILNFYKVAIYLLKVFSILKKRRTTLKDIANELGVSIALVSYVLNNKEKEGRVGAEIAKKIRETALKLDYRPNYAAKSLKNNRQMSIGCIVADISNPFFAELIRKVEDEANKLEYTVVFASSDEDVLKFREIIDFLISRQLDGFLIAPPEGGREDVLKLKEMMIPTVLIDRYYDDVGLNCVVLDNYSGARKISELLLNVGRKKIGMVAYKSDMLHFNQRKAGYLDAQKNAGIENAGMLLKTVNYKNLLMEVSQAIETLISQQKVDAIFFETNSLAVEGLKHITTMGYRIPEDLEVAAFDESEVFYFFDHPIKHIKQPLSEMAKIGVKKLINEIGNENSGFTINYLQPMIMQGYNRIRTIIKG